MTESRGELELYNQWFSLADRDRDGSISGAEAVGFFQLSGLPQHPTLFKVRCRVGWPPAPARLRESPPLTPPAAAAAPPGPLRRFGSMWRGTGRR